MTTHPGVATGWQTDQWLRWVYEHAPKPALVTSTNWLGGTTTQLRNGREAAFAFGYLIHAASDIFEQNRRQLTIACDRFALMAEHACASPDPASVGTKRLKSGTGTMSGTASRDRDHRWNENFR